MRDAISKTRMQRVDRLFTAIPRMVRDLGRDLGKRIDLSLEGGDVEMDREMVEMVVDPLTHIVRNSIDPGIETPEQRRALGKPEAGRLTAEEHTSELQSQSRSSLAAFCCKQKLRPLMPSSSPVNTAPRPS